MRQWPLFFRHKDVMRLLGCSRATASRRMAAIRDFNGIPPHVREIPKSAIEMYYNTKLE